MRHLWFLGLITALAALGYFLLVPQTVVVQGRVVLQSLDGQDTPGAGATIAAYSAEVVDQALRRWLKDFDESRADNRMELQAARRVWTQITARRDEAARILRAAERANSADLEICRARHREAAADAEDALRRMEALTAGLDKATDPVLFVGSLPPAMWEVVAAADGNFRAEVPGDSEIYLVARWTGNEREPGSAVWLRSGRFDDGEKVQFSNANVLTVERLAEIARASKEKPKNPEGSPAG
jgi:hypothetical protein